MFVKCSRVKFPSVGSTERREREKAELRAKILDAARELFAKDGYDAVTMRKIAERIEYSPTAIYLHFADKDALLFELVEGDFAALAQHFMKLGRIDDPLERIVKCGRAYVEFGLAHPNHYLLMFTMPAPAGVKKRMAEKENPRPDAYAFLRDAVREAIEKKMLRRELRDTELVAQTLWSAVHGIVTLQLGRRTQEGAIEHRKPAAITTLMLDVLMRGLKA